jgi:hypothetical protein
LPTALYYKSSCVKVKSTCTQLPFLHSFYQTYSNITSEQASTPAFLGALQTTYGVVLDIKGKSTVTLKGLTAKALRRRLLAAQTDYLADISSGLEPRALITKLDNSVTSGEFSSVLSKASGLSVGVVTIDIKNVSPTSAPTQVPIQQAVVDGNSSRGITGVTMTLPL